METLPQSNLVSPIAKAKVSSTQARSIRVNAVRSLSPIGTAV